VRSSTSGTNTSSGRPAPMIERLRHTTVGRWAAMPFRSWVVSTIVSPSEFRSSSRWSTSCLVRTSRPDVGSSRKITWALVNRARARKTRCCWPPDSSRMWRPPRPSIPSRSSTSAISERSERLIHGIRSPRALAMPTHSATVTGKFQSIVSTCGTSPTASPGARRTRPDTGATVPSIALSNVDLPDPDGPTMPTRSPGSMVRSTSMSTGAPPA
jgi:hypothetical protein